MQNYSLIRGSEVKENIYLFGTFYTIVYDEVKKRLLTLDRCGRSIEIIRFEDGKVKLDVPQKLSEYGAVTMSLSKTNEIYITCDINNAIIVFDDKFTVLRRFNLFDVRDYEKMVLNDDASEMYLSSYEKNKVSRYNTKDGTLIHEYFIIKPWDLVFRSNRLYINNMNKKHTQVIDTTTNETINEIFLENWKELDAIYVDNDSNIFVCASDGTSPEKHLFIFDSNYNLINKIHLGDYRDVTGIVVVDDTLFILSLESDLESYLFRFSLNK